MRKEVLGLCLILVLAFVSANFEVGQKGYDLQEEYYVAQDISGWINLSIENEPSNTLLEDNFGNSVKLIDLLKANSNLNYSCEVADCLSKYTESREETTKKINISKDEEKILGFKIQGDFMKINSLSFNISSDTGPSCSNQLSVDLLDDEKIEFKNNNFLEEVCSSSENYGCFKTGKSTLEAKIEGNSYCQRITLGESEGFRVGAWVKENIAGSMKKIMRLYNKDRVYLGSCDLPVALSSGGEIYCDINYSVKEPEEYYVCINSGGGDGEYVIRGYPDSNGCGYKGAPSVASAEKYSYQIFAKAKKFGSLDNLEISASSKLLDEVNEYLSTRYNNSCESVCVIPIRIDSGVDQNLVIENLIVKYEIGGGFEKSANSFYDLEKAPSKVSGGFQKINLDHGNFSVSRTPGTFNYELSLGGERIFDKNIDVEALISNSSIRPAITALGVPTTFTISQNDFDIINYKWFFGDSKNATTTINKATHTYLATGTYTIKVEMSKRNGLNSSLEFDVQVTSPKNAINSTLNKNLRNIERIEPVLNSALFGDELKSALDWVNLKDSLNNIERDYNKASSDSEYVEIVQKLLELDVPNSVNETSVFNSLTFYPRKENVNLEAIKNVGGGTYKDIQRDKYSDAILIWSQKGVKTKMDFVEFSANYGDLNEESILSTFRMTINKESPEDAYLFVKKMENLQFSEDYSEKETGDYYYIKLKDGMQTIGFSTTDNFDFSNVPVFVSPALKNIKIAEDLEVGQTEDKFSKWTFFGLIIFFLLIAGVVVYVIMQEWYKRKYENYLFKNRNDLYNIMAYISNSKKKNVKEKEIIEGLKKAGWSSEQITYAIKKFSGKRTGMVEIISLNKKKNTQPVQKRFSTKRNNQKFT